MGEGARRMTGRRENGRGARVVLSPPLRRAVADLHAQRVWQEHLAPLWQRANLHQMADLLTLRQVPPVRGSGPWSAMRVHHLVQRVRRSAKAGGKH